MVRVLESEFVKHFNDFSTAVNEWAIDKGFWDDDQGRIQDDLSKLMLVDTEIGECAEGLRHGNPPSDHIPEFSAAEEELADAVIRIMDYAVRRGHKLAEAIEAKQAYNDTRPRMHGKLA